MQSLEDRDYFTDYQILKDPYAFLEAIRVHGPVYRQPGTGVVFVTGFDEALEVLKNTDDFSSANCVQGAGAPLPFTPHGADIDGQIEANRSKFLGSDLLVTYDGRPHTFSRALLGRLFTPSRLKANEQYIKNLSEELVKTAIARGHCELIREISVPFVTLVVADLLGVPADDRQHFMETIASGPPPGALDGSDHQQMPLEFMKSYFTEYVEERRKNPREDVISELANATYPDGSLPDAKEIVSLTTFLFGAGQDTSAKLLANTMKYLVDEPGLQDRVRADLSLVPALLEEVLRIEGSTKTTFRLARRDTRIGAFDVPAGTRVMVALAAANRDPKRWEDPASFVLDRPRAKEHVGFGRGAHVCVGAPLARAELRIIIEDLLKNTSAITMAEEKHGPAGDRRIDWEPSFIIRGIENMYLLFTPAADFVALDRPLRSGIVFGQAEEASAAAANIYSTAATKIGTLFGDPAAKAVLVKHLPGFDTDPQVGMAMGMTFRAIQPFAPDRLTTETLDAMDADLAQLSAP
jgi:cytochrome P450